MRTKLAQVGVQGPPQTRDLGDRAGRERGEDLLAEPSPVDQTRLVIDRAQLLSASPGDLDLDVGFVGGERRFQATGYTALMSTGLLVGAYERDNFGDILFLSRARHYLGDRAAVATAPLAGDTTPFGGDVVRSYADVVDGEALPFVWAVGGATGGTSLKDAMKMAGTVDAGSSATLSGFVSPYLPRMSAYKGTSAAKFIVNSVGVAGAAHLSGRRRIEVESALRESTFLSVREVASSKYLTALGISHYLAPDFVQTLPLDVPPPVFLERDVALVQLKQRHILSLGIGTLTELLASSPQLRKFRVRFFSAGEAPGHDSTPLLHDLAEAWRKRTGSTAEVSEKRTAQDKAAEIAGAGIWVGTSLHGFIVSTAYAVPRIGLLISKVRTYAQTWEIAMPTKVPVDCIDDAIESALSHPTAELESDAERLSLAADANARQILKHIDNDDQPRPRDGERLEVQRALDKVTPAGERLESYTKLCRRLAMSAQDRVRGRA